MHWPSTAFVTALSLGSLLSDIGRADQNVLIDHKGTSEFALIARSFAEQGDAKAQSALGELYLKGGAYPRDYGQSLSWFLRAAEQGDRDAMFAIATMYAEGLGLKPDRDKVAEWYRKAAEAGHRGAQAALGLRYLLGDGIARDEAFAARWTYRAASQGVPDAQLLLAKMLSLGKSIPQDKLAAYSWTTIAASRLSDQKLRDAASKLRQQIGSSLTPGQIAQAEKAAKEWSPALESLGANVSDVSREQDGIVASLSVDRGDAVVSWRFVRPQPVPISDLSGTIDGEPLGVPRLEPYPTEGTKTWILLVLDVADPNRGPEIRRDKDTLATLVSHAQPHDEIDLATYGDRLQLLLPAGSGEQPLAEILSAAVSQAVPANLGQALQKAIALPSPTPVARRGIFVLTDAHSDDVLNVAGLIEAANSNHTALNFLVSPSTRLGDLSALEALATATGGLVVKDEELPTFLQSPFGLLDSGAVAHFPIDHVVRDSQTDPKISVVFGYGGRTFELSTHLPNEARIARQGLEQTLNSCEGLCSEDFKNQIRSRIELISAEEKTYDAAGDDPTKLRAYGKECRVCSFRGEAEARAESLERQLASINPTPEHATTNPESVPVSRPVAPVVPRPKSVHLPLKGNIEQTVREPRPDPKLYDVAHRRCVASAKDYNLFGDAVVSFLKKCTKDAMATAASKCRVFNGMQFCE